MPSSDGGLDSVRHNTPTAHTPHSLCSIALSKTWVFLGRVLVEIAEGLGVHAETLNSPRQRLLMQLRACWCREVFFAVPGAMPAIFDYLA